MSTEPDGDIRPALGAALADPDIDIRALPRVLRLAASWASCWETTSLPADEVTAHVGRTVLDMLNSPDGPDDVPARLAAVARYARSLIAPGGGLSYPVAGLRILDAISGEKISPRVLIEEALHLRQNGERAPGGNETWAGWERKAEQFLRGLEP